MILQLQEVRLHANIFTCNLTWQELFRSSICHQNEYYRHIMNQQSQEMLNENLTRSQTILQKAKNSKNKNYFLENVNMKQLTTILSKKPIRTCFISTPQTPQGDYSSFVPIRGGNYMGRNECSREFQNFQFLEQNNLKMQIDYFQDFALKVLEEIQQTGTPKIINLLKDKVSKKFIKSLSFSERVQMMIKAQAYGSKYFSKFSCPNSILHNTCLFQKFIEISRKNTKNLSVSIQKSDKISIQSVSHAMKTLYCPLCMIYDCSKHYHKTEQFPESNYQYLCANNNRFFGRQKKSLDVIKMMKIGETGVSQEKDYVNKFGMEGCSSQCYHRMGELKKQKNFEFDWLNKQAKMSELKKVLIEMGVQLFSFSPCFIKNLFPAGQLSCIFIYKYLITQFKCLDSVYHKMFFSEQQMLKKQQANQNVTMHKAIFTIRKKKLKLKSKSKSSKLPFPTDNFSICMHHFVNYQSFDEHCLQCICNSRGYCIPACLCSDKCLIPKIGCKCKKNGCRSAECPCFSSFVECIPGVCGKWCSSVQTCCENQQIQQRSKKNVKIGVSKVEGAGLGLFAGESIKKDSLVTVYLGEKIDDFTLNLRDKLRKDNSFYNFQNNDSIIDSRFYGNKSRFINHSGDKNQNLKVRVVESQGQKWIAFYALRDIHRYEEFFFDYDGDGELAKHHSKHYPFILPK